jgi:hypothetical protein
LALPAHWPGTRDRFQGHDSRSPSFRENVVRVPLFLAVFLAGPENIQVTSAGQAKSPFCNPVKDTKRWISLKKLIQLTSVAAASSAPPPLPSLPRNSG